MEGGLLKLRWRDHLSAISHMLPVLRKKEVYCDATIACDGRFYPVHRLVLSTCSEYFERMFEVTDKQDIMIVLTDIHNKDLEILLDYMYLGEVNILSSDLSGFMKNAERLKIKGLVGSTEASPRKDCVNGKRNLPESDEVWVTKRIKEKENKDTEKKVNWGSNEEDKESKQSIDELYEPSKSDGVSAFANVNEICSDNTVLPLEFTDKEGKVILSSYTQSKQQHGVGDDRAAPYNLDVSKINLEEIEEVVVKDEPEDWCEAAEGMKESEVLVSSGPNLIHCNISEPVSKRVLRSDDEWNFTSLVDENPSYSLGFKHSFLPNNYMTSFNNTSVARVKSSMTSDVLQVGDKFSSLDKLERAISLYETETMTKLYKRDSRKLMKKRVRRDIKAELVYYDIVYACVKGGRIYYPKGSRSHNTLKRGCTMHIRLKATQDGQFLEVVHKVEDHNHSLTDKSVCYKGKR